jgi:hypothetical protein
VGHYSKDCPKSKSGSEDSKVIALTTNLAEAECNRLIFLKGKIVKWDVLCLLEFLTKGFSQFHNPRKRWKDGAPIGRAQSTHWGALYPSHYVTNKKHASPTRKLERKGGLVGFHLRGDRLCFGNGIHRP